MRLPQPLLESRLFLFERIEELERALGVSVPPREVAEIRRLFHLGLPPVTSSVTLATIFGLNAGIFWSFINQSRKHYRSFVIRKGTKSRQIHSPRIALKIVQKWIATQLSRAYDPPVHVHGFVPGRSHVSAAERHVNARWVLSFDIENFFPTTTQTQVIGALQRLGYSEHSASLVASLCCLDGGLSQGSPSSPVLANLCFAEQDEAFSKLATRFGVRFTRYADDLTFSGDGEIPEKFKETLVAHFRLMPWRIADRKTHFAALPNRLKVHGLLVHGRRVRLTKGYRNKLRLYKYLDERGLVRSDLTRQIKGHLAFGNFVEAREPEQSC